MIGKATVAVITLLFLLCVVAARVPSEWAMLTVGGAGVVALFGYLFFLEYFVNKHPDVAATEGLTYVQSRQIGLAAKGLPKIPYTDIVPDPQNPTLLDQSLAPPDRGSDG
jgi:hypothetical protein